MSVRELGGNPLGRAARALPQGVGWAMAAVCRAAGAGALVALAMSTDFDRTRGFALGTGVIVATTLLGLLPTVRGRLRWTAWLGAGVLFFSGALLASLTLGVVAVTFGLLAAIGAAIDDGQQRRSSGMAAFFLGFGLTIALVTLTVLSIAG